MNAEYTGLAGKAPNKSGRPNGNMYFCPPIKITMTKWIIIGSLVVLGVLIYRFTVGSYNNMVAMEETVAGKWSEVETQYQRRLDLVQNLVNTVKGYADFERTTLTQVVEARARATQVTLDPDKLTPEKLREFQQAQSDVSTALSRLLLLVERYPDLKANKNFLELQAQLEGTENRIAVARSRYNDAARNYNTLIRKFPQNLIAGIFDFTSKAYFEAEPQAATVPRVEF
jgi:LemA protein